MSVAMLTRVARSVRAGFRSWRRQMHVDDTIAKQGTRILADVDRAMADMPAITRPRAGPMVLLPRRLELAGLDAGTVEDADPAVFDELQLACGQCTRWRRCARNLASGPPAHTLSGFAYCRNSPTIDRLIVERRAGLGKHRHGA